MLLLAYWIPAAAATEQEDLTELGLEALLNVEVYSASKFVQKSSEAPAAVTVITADDIRTYGHRTLADILRSARGLYTAYDRNYVYSGIRGFNRPGDYNTRLLVLVDGYRINDAVYDQGSVGTDFPVDVDLIERVEIVRGAGSSVYGSNAFFGVVNVITRGGAEQDGVEVAGGIASYGTDKERATVGWKHANGFEWLLSGSRYHSDGQDLFFPEFDDPATNNGAADDVDGDRSEQFFGKIAYGDFGVTGAYSSRRKEVPTGSYGTVFNDPDALTTDEAGFADLNYRRDINPRWSFSGRAFYGTYSYEGDYPYGPPVVVNHDDVNGEWWGAEARLFGQFERHKIVLGAEYQNNIRQDQINFDIDPYFQYLDERRSSNREGLYIQDEMTLGEHFQFNAGLRYDRYSTLGGTVNPRLAVIWTPSGSTTVKVLYGTAFRPPNVYELYYATPPLVANPQLDSEEITSVEFIVEHYLRPNLRVTADFYRNEISSLIDQIADPLTGDLQFINVGGAEARGVELEAEGIWENGVRLRASYAWQRTEDEATESRFTSSPVHMAKLNLSMPLLREALRAGLEVQYLGDRKTLAGDTAQGHLLVNLTLLNQSLVEGLELSASVYNLFDDDYADPGGAELIQDTIPQDGRNFRVKLGYRF